MIVCERCRIGRCHERRVPYFYQMGRHLLIVPDVPALVCDVCELLVYEDGYMAQLHQLISQTANPEAISPSEAERRMIWASQPNWSRPRRSI
jgi:YgiT-type zinc finger domain-containing protein